MTSKKYLIIAVVLSLFAAQLTAQKWVASPGSNNLLPDKYYVSAIKVVSRDTIWAVASLAQFTIPANHLIKVLRTTNGGQTWQVLNVSAAIGRIGYDIQVLSPTTAWVSTFDRSLTNVALFKTTDGGQTWVEKFKGMGAQLRFLDANNGVWVPIINSRKFAYTSDGGDNWTVDSTSMPLLNAESVGFSSTTGTNSLIRKGDTLWIGTSAGRVMRSINKGRNWTAFSTGIPSTWSIASVAFKDARNGMLAGVDLTTDVYRGIAKTNDGGVTWQIVPQSAISSSFPYRPTLTTIPNKDEKTYLFSLENALGTVATSILTLDDGNSWQGIDKNIHSYAATEFISPQIGWVGNGYVNNASNPAAMFKWDDNGLFTPTAEQYDNTFFSINPNPTREVLNLQFENANNLEAFNAHITDVAGKVVFKTNTSDKQLKINHLPDGIYFLTVKTKDKIGVTKFVKN
jgi:photosystem II stability/assembly factor-like uncharacterized protein